MITELTIPGNLDLAKLIETELPNYNGNKSGITEQNLAYICHSIIQQWFTYKDDYIKQKYKHGGFVPLCATYLKDIVAQYKNCLDFLKSQNVLLSDGVYIPEEKCMYYTFYEKYIGQGFRKLPVEGRVKRNLYRYYDEKRKEKKVIIRPLEKRRKQLVKTLKSPMLTINAEEAKRAINLKYMVAYRKAFRNEDKEAMRQAQINRDVSYGLVECINNTKDEYIIIDTSGYRLHSPITRLPKYLRQYLSYNESPLISLDVKNSQPYFSIRILKKAFYDKRKVTNRGGVYYGGIDKETWEIIIKKEPIMLQKIAETIDNTTFLDLEMYQKDVLDGRLYDKFILFPKGDPKYSECRNAIKKELLTTMYDLPRPDTNRFKEAYPEVFKLFDILKSVKTGKFKRRRVRCKNPKEGRQNIQPAVYAKGAPKRLFSTPYTPNKEYQKVDRGYTKLAILLQRIESYLLLDIVCKNLYETYPDIPLITIHDCIATTPQYVECLKKAISETLTKYIGHPPKLEEEAWTNEEYIIYNNAI